MRRVIAAINMTLDGFCDHVSFPIIQPVHLELARRCIVNFKIYKHEKEAYRRPDSGRY